MAKEKIIIKRKVAGNILECQVCRHNEFWTRQTLMNTVGLTFFNLDWANKEATNYVCSNCGYVMWFLPQN